MSLFDDHPGEMQTQPLFDERTIDSILAGRSPDGRSELDGLADFVDEVRSVATATAPKIGAALAAVLAGGLSTDEGDVPATAAGSVTGAGGQQAAARSTKRRSILAKALSVKAAAVLGGLTIATTGAAAADLLPQPAQNGVAAVVEAVSPLDLPDSGEKAKDGEHRQDDTADHQPDPDVEDNFGADVSDRARTAEDKGKDFGESVRNDAPKADPANDAPQRPPAGRPTPSNRPGTSRNDTVPAQPSPTTPAASDNPGTPHRDSAPGRQSSGTPAADGNSGSVYRP